MSGLQLKIIACVSMLIDHIGAVLYPNLIFLRVIGRLAFPIYCFLLVQGFFHTSNLKKYIVRVGIFTIISEIPFDLAVTGHWSDFRAQNIYLTLCLGLCCMAVCRWAQKIQQPIIIIVAIPAACFIAQIVRADYQWFGIAMIMVFYLFYQSKSICYLVFMVLVGMYCLIYTNWVQALSICALIPIYFYNGQRGIVSLRYGFYLFYPVHLLILFMMKKLIL